MGRGCILFLLALSIAGCMAGGADPFIFNHEVCAAGIREPFKTLNGAGDLEGGIFFSLSFTGEGKVSHWEFNALWTGVFYADVWDIDHKTNQGTLKFSNRIEVTETGFQDHVLRPVKKPYVEPGYVIGIHYDSQATQAVLSWERSGQPTTTAGVMLSQYQPAGKGLAVGTVVNVSPLQDRATPGLKAIVEGPATNLRFMPEGDYRMGRVEIKLGDVWGSVCDLWFELLGWPNLFCVELGFPGAVAANYTNNPLIGIPGDWDRYVVPKDQRDQYPIHMMNPRCKVSDKIKFVSCDRHHRDCGHRQDMFVECQSKMKCDRNRTTTRTANKQTRWLTRCVPMIYEDGKWGYVSESRDLSLFEDDQSSWMSAFCKEIGLENVKSATNAYTKGLVEDTLPVLRCDPECLDDNPKRIGNCPSGPYRKDKCKHENVPFITCEIERPTNWMDILQAERLAKVAERDATKAEKEARRAKKQTQKMVKQAKNAVIQGSKKQVQAAVRNARIAANNAERAAVQAEKDKQNIERDLAKFETAALRDAEKIAEAAAKNAKNVAKQAEKMADKIEKQAAKALRKATRLEPGTPEYDAAMEEAMTLMEEAEAASKAAMEAAEKALAEADEIAAAAENHAEKEIKKAEKKADRDISKAIREVKKAARKAAAATSQAERLSSRIASRVTKTVNKATEKATKLVERAEKRVTNAEKKADKLLEKAENMTKERYDQDGNLVPF